MPEKIKITKAEINDIYEVIDGPEEAYVQAKVSRGEVVETDNVITETFDEAVERHSKKEIEDDLHGT